MWVATDVPKPNSERAPALPPIPLTNSVPSTGTTKFTRSPAGATGVAAENSEVLFVLSVAVAVIHSPALVTEANATLKVAFPVPSVVTVVEPRYRSPSP